MKYKMKKMKLTKNDRTKKLLVGALCAMLVLTMCIPTAFAADNAALSSINKFTEIAFGIIKAIGMVILGFGIVQVGLSLKSHDPSQRANGFLTLASGIVICFAKEILNAIV